MQEHMGMVSCNPGYSIPLQCMREHMALRCIAITMHMNASDVVSATQAHGYTAMELDPVNRHTRLL